MKIMLDCCNCVRCSKAGMLTCSLLLWCVDQIWIISCIGSL